ncbi:MAG: DUF6179 domain-containing protein [Lacrimispora sp.]|uniref:DUF6179 domain-containing protein n=1 Tax=Lacrimispora sp. TaxID=2719234 RepID=UPI0039E5DA8E
MKKDNMEELLPLVGELAEKYTGRESTSITYEKARQLMGAVLYCIREYEEDLEEKEGLISPGDRAEARTAYRLGYEKVLEKVKETQALYNHIIGDFNPYGNRCCYDTFAKGLPSFFLYYDPRFAPQDHLLTLDYPVLRPMDSLRGIDAIYVYVKSIGLEQIFLGKFPEEYIFHVLKAYSADHKGLLINPASIVFRNVLGCRMAGKGIHTGPYTGEEVKRLENCINGSTGEELELYLKGLTDELMDLGYGNDEELGEYLKGDIHDYVFELKQGIKNRCLNRIIAI